MNVFGGFAGTLFVILLCGEAEARQVVDLDFGWMREVGGVTNIVDVPDDFLLNVPWDRNAGGGRAFKPVSEGVYRKFFFAEPSWRGRRGRLEFDGVMCRSEVKLNGRLIAENDYGYLGFEVDVSDWIRYGESNLVEVLCSTGPINGSRWYTGCGICRDVRLVLKDRVSFARHPLNVMTPVAERDRAVVVISADIAGGENLEGRVAIVRAVVSGPDGSSFARVEAVVGRGSPERTSVRFPEVEIAAPRRWDVADPALYRVAATLYIDGRETDAVSTAFGIRKIEFSPDFGFRLNDRKLFVQGIANHQDDGALGVAAFRRTWTRRITRLKEFGYNAIRCSHHPYPEVMLEECDRLGVVVIDEIVDKWRGCWFGKRPFFEQAPDLIGEWMRRDRTHPCVIMWSLGNETQHDSRYLPMGTGDWGVSEYERLKAVAREYDTTRPTTVAMYPARAGGVQRADPGFWTNVVPPELSCRTEIASYNYVPDDYAAYRRLNPKLIVFQSEASVRGRVKPYYLMDREHSVGLCYWGAIEYWGESDGWPKKGWNYSFFSRGLEPYPTAWHIRSAFSGASGEPIARLAVKHGEDVTKHWTGAIVGRESVVSHWNFKPGERKRVYVYTNGDEAELFLNGQLLGVRANPRDDLERADSMCWDDVAWQPGCLKAIVRRKGLEVASHLLETTGPAEGIEVEVETSDDWRADGHDLKFVHVYAVDARKRRVPEVDGIVRFKVSGAATLYATDNGDSQTDGRFDVPEQPFYRGGALAVLRARRQPGPVKLSVDAGRFGTSDTDLRTVEKGGE